MFTWIQSGIGGKEVACLSLRMDEAAERGMVLDGYESITVICLHYCFKAQHN